jgi:hypothetical protein
VEVLARIGLSDKAIAESVGISPDTFIRWKKCNREFSDRIKKRKVRGREGLSTVSVGMGRKVGKRLLGCLNASILMNLHWIEGV